MEIEPNIQIIDLALYFEKEKLLVLSDFHLGYEEALNKQGVFIPMHQFEDTKRRLENIFKKVKDLKTVVINGDLKHEFGTISRQEWSDAFAILDCISKNCEKIVLVKGNHDTVLGSLVEKKNLQIKNSFAGNGLLILHGNKLPETQDLMHAKIIVIGHEHPAINLKDKLISEKVKCFLKGKWNKQTLIVQPSFNLITEGTDVLSEKLLSPFLKQIKDFEVWAVAGSEKILHFGKIKDIVKTF